ncbi:Staphylococcal virulence regulator protein A [uncultured Eubacterium sp.]|nr:Staphylococcal virulence regulator protein A [uncultured Eubacterium sp.]
MTKSTKKEIKNRFIKYVIPSVAAMWVYTIYTMVDGMFVARGVGTTALAAVNISMPFINTAFALGILFAVGASTKASIYKGQGDMEKANKVFTMSTVTVFGLAFIVATVALLNLERLALMLGADEATLPYVKDYLGIIIPFVVCYMTSYNLEVLIKADGYPQKAIATTLAGAATNIILDYVFVLVLHWGIKGAAIATGISQLMTLSIFLAHFLSKKSQFSFVKIKWNFKEVVSMAKIGVADSVTEFSVGAIIFLFNNTLIRVSGNDGVVIYTVIAYVSQLILMTMMGVNQGMQPLVSYYHGREEHKIHKYILRIALLVAGTASIVAFAWGVLYPNPVVAVFIDRTTDAVLYENAVDAFKLFSFSFLPLGVVVILAGYFTALERPKSAMTISICRGLVLVVISLVIMTMLFGEIGIWLSMGVSETIALILAVTMYKKKLQ